MAVTSPYPTSNPATSNNKLLLFMVTQAIVTICVWQQVFNIMACQTSKAAVNLLKLSLLK